MNVVLSIFKSDSCFNIVYNFLLSIERDTTVKTFSKTYKANLDVLAFENRSIDAWNADLVLAPTIDVLKIVNIELTWFL